MDNNSMIGIGINNQNHVTPLIAYSILIPPLIQVLLILSMPYLFLRTFIGFHKFESFSTPTELSHRYLKHY